MKHSGCVFIGSAMLAALANSADAAAPSRDWYDGDTHVHDDHSADGSLLRQLLDQKAPGDLAVGAQIREGERRRLDWMPLTDHRTYDQHYDPQWQSDKLLLIPGEEANGSPHATVLGAVDTIVQGANRPGAPEVMRLQQSIWDAHAQDAVWNTAHPDDGELDGTVPNVQASAVGIDNVETWNRASDPEAEIDYAENRWNAGYRFGVVGGSDNHFRETWALQGPGMPVTSVLATARSERALLDSLRAGHTRIGAPGLLPGGGPRVWLEADFDGDGAFEAIGGDELRVRAGSVGRLRIHAQNALGTTLLLYRAPGRAAGAFRSYTPLVAQPVFEQSIIAGDQPGWYRVEARGPGLPAAINLSGLPQLLLDTLTELPNQLRAFSSPIFVAPIAVAARPEVPLPADEGVDDGAVPALGNLLRFAGFPAIASANGVQHVVAEIHPPGATYVAYRRFDAAGKAAPLRVLTPFGGSARFPKIAARGDEVWVAWQDEADGQVPRRPAIWLRHSRDGGRSWLAPRQIRALAGRAEHPDLALDRVGHPVLVWQEISSDSAFEVMAQVIGVDAAPVDLSSSGKVLSKGSPLDSRSARYPGSVWPVIAVAADGRIAVAFQDDRDDPEPLWTGSVAGRGTDPDDWQIRVRVRSADGSWSAPAALGAADRADRHPALAWASDGTLVAAWDSKELQSSGVNLAIESAWSIDGGTSWTAPQAIGFDADAMSQYPKLAAQSSGEVRAVWYDSRSNDWRWRIASSRFDATQGWQPADLTQSRGINTWPALADGVIAFASTRNARALQRDRTQQVFLMRR